MARTGDPAKIGPYRVLRPLVAGTMGPVYLARSTGGKQVAVKLLRPELAADAAYRVRFAAEVAAARRVVGGFTAPVVDADPFARRPWLATAFVVGPTLEQRIRRSGPMDGRRLRDLGAALAGALTAIHGAGVVHRDLKPGNVLMSVDGPRVVDFGIGKEPTAYRGGVTGTSGFAAPEQLAASGDAGWTSDVFALAAVLTFAALGRGPFGTGDPRALRYRIAHEEPDLTGVPDELRLLIGRCLAKNPHARPSVADVLGALTALGRPSASGADGGGGGTGMVGGAGGGAHGVGGASGGGTGGSTHGVGVSGGGTGGTAVTISTEPAASPSAATVFTPIATAAAGAATVFTPTAAAEANAAEAPTVFTATAAPKAAPRAPTVFSAAIVTAASTSASTTTPAPPPAAPTSRRSVLKIAGICAAAVTVVAGGLSLLETFGVLTDGHQDIPPMPRPGAPAPTSPRTQTSTQTSTTPTTSHAGRSSGASSPAHRP